VGGAADGSLTVVEEFSTLHFRSSFMPGSIVGGKMRSCVGGVIETSSLRRGDFARIEIVRKRDCWKEIQEAGVSRFRP
jgi:hypothetical protein